MARREASNVLNRAGKLFETASMGLLDVDGPDANRRLPGLHTLIVFGRAVTFVLQNLRTIDEAAFDDWYEPYQSEMKADPLLRFFNRLRTDLEKEGRADAYTVTFVIGDRSETRLHLYSSPSDHLGESIRDPSAYGLSQLYLRYIRRMLMDAHKRFGNKR